MQLDHIVLVAPSLDEGISYVSDKIGIEPLPGGQHREIGTHNALLPLAPDQFLEIIAVDPSAASVPQYPRCYGLSDWQAVRQNWDAGRRLRAWVARTKDLNPILSRHEALLGRAYQITRGVRSWRMSIPDDGSLVWDGIVPTALEYGDDWIPGRGMPDLGCSIAKFIVRHPNPIIVCNLYTQLGLTIMPELEQSDLPQLIALINTPSGIVELA